MFTFDNTVKYLEETRTRGSILGLENIAQLLKYLNNPQDSLKFIHVAGTNGKGSICSYISSVLTCAGYKIGTYNSPAVFSYCEKIQVSGNYITEEEVANYIYEIKLAEEIMIKKHNLYPTEFEVETAMAFLHYKHCNCDIVVLETGLGGRLDATNIIKTPICTVFSLIDIDHKAFLGDTIEEITVEKAGIIKSGVPVVSYKQQCIVENILKEKSTQYQSDYISADFTCINNTVYSLLETTFNYKEFDKLQIRLLGENQVKNAVTAIEAVALLREKGYNIQDTAIYTGLLETVWQGRFQIIHKEPIIIIDGAHNESGAISLAKSIECYFSNIKSNGGRLIYVVGIFADKEYTKVLSHTVPMADLVYTVTPNNSRGLSSKELAREARKFCKHVIEKDNIKEAMDEVESISNEKDIIIVFGTLSFLEFFALYK